MASRTAENGERRRARSHAAATPAQNDAAVASPATFNDNRIGDHGIAPPAKNSGSMLMLPGMPQSRPLRNMVTKISESETMKIGGLGPFLRKAPRPLSNLPSPKTFVTGLGRHIDEVNGPDPASVLITGGKRKIQQLVLPPEPNAIFAKNVTVRALSGISSAPNPTTAHPSCSNPPAPCLFVALPRRMPQVQHAALPRLERPIRKF